MKACIEFTLGTSGEGSLQGRELVLLGNVSEVFRMETDNFENQDGEELNEVYADCFRIGHSAYKFVLDFGQFASEGETKKCFHTRVFTGPDTAKAFLETFEQSIRQYEAQFGRITLSD